MAKKKAKGNSVGGVIFLTVIFLLIAGLCAYNLSLGLLGEETTAIVTDMDTSEKYDDESNDRTYELTVSYKFSVDGESYTGSGTYTSRSPINIIKDASTGELTAPGFSGSRLTVVYMPQTPKRNMPSDLVAFKGGGIKSAALQIGIIAAMLILTVFINVNYARKRRKTG